MNEELDSQLSAMFDDELPAAECELLARRLSRDDALKSRWGRYALIGAVIRAERGVVLQSAVAGRVTAALSREPQLADGTAGAPYEGFRSASAWLRVVSGAGLAAAVAVVSILWLRWHALGPIGGPQQMASVSVRGAAHAAAGPAVDGFMVPAVSTQAASLMPPTALADYVVAHSAYAWPFSGGGLLSSFMVQDSRSLAPPARPEQRAAGHGHASAAAH
ncbi:MAG: sigma-E factor negative regulatory protein [Steroidobacteraceae bacterium]